MIFQKIIDREIAADIVYENEYVLAFKDINPKAPVHILIIPKVPMRNLDDVRGENLKYIEEIFRAIPIIASQEGIKGGYRVVSNCGQDAGQEIFHLHFHILGGKRLGEIC